MRSFRALKDFSYCYDRVIQRMWRIKAGGKLRSLKGALVETLAEQMVLFAWKNVAGKPSALEIVKKKVPIRDPAGNTYRLSQDKQVYVGGKFILSIECKAYAEVAMYKRILTDAYLLQKQFPDLAFCLFQLESMLGGDFSTSINHPNRSPSVRALEHYFPGPKLQVLTLLDGEREIKGEIHKKPFYKPINPDRLKFALDYFERILKPRA